MYNSHGSSIEGYPGMYSSTLVRGLIGGTQVTMYSNTSWGSGEGGGSVGCYPGIQVCTLVKGSIGGYIQICTLVRSGGYPGMYTVKGLNMGLPRYVHRQRAQQGTLYQSMLVKRINRGLPRYVHQSRGSIGNFPDVYTSQVAQSVGVYECIYTSPEAQKGCT